MEEWGDYDDEEEATRPVWKRPVLWVAAVAVLAAIAGIAYVALNKDDSTPNQPVTLASTPTTDGANVSTPATTAARATTTAGSAGSSTSAASTTIAESTTEESSTAAPTTVADTVPATTAAAPDTTVAAAPLAAPTYSTLPDGSPAPIIAVFSEQDITLTGSVPDQASKDKLQALAIANSKFPVPVKNLLTIDPTVPIGIGVRVVELTSARFAPNSAKIEGLHALELDRIVSVMNALPNVTALIIGHADQIGSDAQNFKISAERAAAVVTYIASKGISPSRLSSRAVGDTDLLTLNDDAASLALNRRTEIVFYGLLSS